MVLSGSSASLTKAPAQRELTAAYRVTLTALGVLALAANELAARHREARPQGCPGCDACRRLLPVLRRLLAAGRAEQEAA
jgi:hypothetical protein